MTIDLIVLVPVFAGLIVFLLLRVIIPLFKENDIVGRDLQKPGHPLVAEMGGLAIVVGFAAAMLLVIAFKTFFQLFIEVNLVEILAVLVTVLLIGLIGIVDDLVAVHQLYKAIMPVFAALPLMAIKAGDTVMNLPFLGFTDVGLLYTLLLIPLGITGASNAINMLAGFNGAEAGMGVVMFASLTVIAFSLAEWSAVVILLAALGATLVCLYYNWFPAKVFVGDVGTLTMGALVASAVIVGNFEMAGFILMVPHLVDFFFKSRNGFPKTFGIYRDGKLYCPQPGPAGLGQWIMRASGGIQERHLTLALIGIELVMGLIAVSLYARFER